MRTLNSVEIDDVSGAADGCMYDGKVYSTGAVVPIGNGYYQKCMANQYGVGWYWSAPYLL